MATRRQTKYNNDHKALVQLGHHVERKLAGRERLADAPQAQATLGSLLELSRMLRELGRLEKKVKAAVVQHLREGGCCEKGALVAALQVSEKRSPGWKDIAIDTAPKLARCQGKKFDEEKYVKRVLKRTPASSSHRLKIEPKDEEE